MRWSRRLGHGVLGACLRKSPPCFRPSADGGGVGFCATRKPQVGWVLLLNPGDDLFGGLAGLGPGQLFSAVAKGQHGDDAFGFGVDDAVVS